MILLPFLYSLVSKVHVFLGCHCLEASNDNNIIKNGLASHESNLLILVSGSMQNTPVLQKSKLTKFKKLKKKKGLRRKLPHSQKGITLKMSSSWKLLSGAPLKVELCFFNILQRPILIWSRFLAISFFADQNLSITAQFFLILQLDKWCFSFWKWAHWCYKDI